MQQQVSDVLAGLQQRDKCTRVTVVCSSRSERSHRAVFLSRIAAVQLLSQQCCLSYMLHAPQAQADTREAS
jgi:hypothetical protein